MKLLSMPKIKKAIRYRHQVPLLLSTDIAGIFALNPQLFYQLIQTLTADCCHIDGVEFLPFRFSHQKVHQALTKANIPIIGIHGPVAWNTTERNLFEKLYCLPFAGVMPSLNSAYQLTTKAKPNYLLFHEPDFNDCCFSKKLTAYLKQENTATILIENVYRANSLQISVDQAKKLANQTQAGVMIDLVHLLHEVMELHSFFTSYHRRLNSKNIDEYWLKMLIQADLALEQIPVACFHIPLGTNHDSLPWKLLNTKHWQQFAKLLDKHNDRLIALTLENQHLETVLSMTAKKLPTLIKDKKEKIQTLISTRVL
jgi:hypothetical protein